MYKSDAEEAALIVGLWGTLSPLGFLISSPNLEGILQNPWDIKRKSKIYVLIS